MNRDAVAWVRGVVLAHDPSDTDADTLLFLLREYATSGGDAVRQIVEIGLTRALAASPIAQDPCGAVEWLRVLAEAAGVSDDDRLRNTVLRSLPVAIDGLEQFVRRRYEPGSGLLDGDCTEQLTCSGALLGGFDLSGRLPYAMLAEELVQHARRHWWLASAGVYDADFSTNCRALGILCRLAALHLDDDYRAAAVVAPSSSYEEDARRVAEMLVRECRAHPLDAAPFGSALLEWLALQPKLQ